MKRIRLLFSTAMALLAVIVAWLERKGQTDRETSATPVAARTDAASASTADRAPARQAAAGTPPQPMAPPSPSEPDAQTTTQTESSAETAAAADQPAARTTTTDDATTVDSATPTAAPPDVLAVAAGDLAAGGAERRHGRSVPGDGSKECPPEYPIKGNADSRIYHRPGDSSYAATIAELCFASAEDAEAEGFRPRKR